MHPDEDLARNKPAQQLLRWRRRYVRRHPLRVLKGLVDGVPDDEYRRITQGIRGERAVARELRAFLGRHPRWRVLHSIVTSAAGTDLDHLVIGPPGVYTINTKHWSGRRITGRRETVRTSRTDGSARHGEVRTLRSARHESDKVSVALSTAVGLTVSARPVVTFVDPAEVRDELSADGVRLLALDTFQSWFDAQDASPGNFTGDEVAALYQAARHPATWLAAQRTRRA
ncbi:nuclease-related domain-containing protein [Myceligenerans salitolerans]|uniref:NERD domain-containing protein n=1 Tax=Myceligenerans salitolerans TaxID=1230528 RepID=A0ABS3ID31_9MICO|nr:nuclease-related domain-containing protein [Myceligenerans salitolerans]MBO0610890.1 NERD domain-containing protein [Myceligenerans salitolerans]